MAEIWGYGVEQLLEMDRTELGLVILRQFREGQEFHSHNVTLGAKSLAERAAVGSLILGEQTGAGAFGGASAHRVLRPRVVTSAHHILRPSVVTYSNG